MIPPNRELRLQEQQSLMATPTEDSEAQPQHPSTKPEKQSHPQRDKTPPAFWDALSRVPLCRRALRELDRRTYQPIVLLKLRAQRDIEDSQVKQLQRFARNGGPDLRRIRGYPEHKAQTTMPKNRPSAQPAQSSNARMLQTTYADAAFRQALIDNHVYPPGPHSQPVNLDEIRERLSTRRASIPTTTSLRDDFLQFQHANWEATNEAEILCDFFNTVVGKSKYPRGMDVPFSNLVKINDVAAPKPDYFNGSRSTDIRSEVLEELNEYIVPSRRDRPVLPNFFLELKGPESWGTRTQSQITRYLAFGERGMFKMQSYGLQNLHFDRKAHTFGATFSSGIGITSGLQLYAMHATEPEVPGGPMTFRTTRIMGFDLTSDLESFLRGVAAFRNLQDMAAEWRAEFIARANVMADNNDSDSTSADELAAPAPLKKRAKTRKHGAKRRRTNVGHVVVDEDDDMQCV